MQVNAVVSTCPEQAAPCPAHRWRDIGVFAAPMNVMIAEAADRTQVDMSLVGIDSTAVRAHHDAAGMPADEDVLATLEKAIGRSGTPG